MILPADETKKITDKVLARSHAQHCSVTISQSEARNLRFARNNATTNGARNDVSVYVTSSFGKRAGTATVTSLDAPMLADAVARSEEIARRAPENPEFMPPLGPQIYLRGAAFDATTAEMAAAPLARDMGVVIKEALARERDVAGFGSTGQEANAVATSEGLFGYDRRTSAGFSVTAHRRDGGWSGWAGSAAIDYAGLDIAGLGRRAIDKSAFQQEPVDLEPGKYTVILEPSAAADLVGLLVHALDARAADEGRSVMSRKGGGNRRGAKLFSDKVTIFSDPADPLAPEPLFDWDGLPARRTAWVENGIVRSLITSRYWAQKTGTEPLPRPRNIVMAGGDASLQDLIAQTERGVLVTRFWYIRLVDPRTLLFTGLTRDGNFLIENGRIAAPARNMRFNESPIAMLANLAAMGRTERTRGGESPVGAAVPPLLVKDFTFSSRSDAI